MEPNWKLRVTTWTDKGEISDDLPDKNVDSNEGPPHTDSTEGIT